MTGLDFQIAGKRYRTFAARVIRDFGRCPNDPGLHIRPYKWPDVIDDSTLELPFVICPTCFTRWDTECFDSYQSTEPPFSRIPEGLIDPLVIPDVVPQPPLIIDPLPNLSETTFDQLGLINEPEPPPQPRWGNRARRRGPIQVSLADAQVLSVVPGERRFEPDGDDTYEFDYSGSSSTSVETLVARHTTEFLMMFHTEDAVERNGQGSVSLFNLAQVAGRLQSAVRQQHSLQLTSTMSFEHTSQISIPARTRVEVTLRWWRVWQDGVINLSTQADVEVTLPYSITIALKYDIKKTDVA